MRLKALIAAGMMILVRSYMPIKAQQQISGKAIDGITGLPVGSIEVVINYHDGIQKKTVTGTDGTYNLIVTDVKDNQSQQQTFSADVNTIEAKLQFITPEPTRVKVAFYNCLGQEVSQIQMDVTAGVNRTPIPTGVASGVYFYIR